MNTIIVLVALLATEPYSQVGFLRTFDKMSDCQKFIRELKMDKEHKSKMGCLQIVRQDKNGVAI